MAQAIAALNLDSRAIETAVEESLAPRVRSALNPIYSPDYSELRYYRVEAELTQEEIAEAVAVIDAAHVPADRQLVTKEVTRLLLATKSRADGDDDLRLRMAIYIEELGALPADAVISGCRAWARENTWAPSLAEILKECAGFCQRRIGMRRALEAHAHTLARQQRQK
jgi:hypothetical protein